jgi:hypothetical protein
VATALFALGLAAGALCAAPDVTPAESDVENPTVVLPRVIEDTNFSAMLGSGFNGGVYALAIGPKGGIIAGGGFTSFNGVYTGRLARLVYNESTKVWQLDRNFSANLGTGFDNDIYDIAVAVDGDITVGGEFTSLNGVSSNYIAQVTIDGLMDPVFHSHMGAGFDNTVRALRSNPITGDIVVGGDFLSYNGQKAYELTRLHNDGTLDTPFATTLGTRIFDGNDGGVMGLDIDTAGNIYAGGAITVAGCASQGLAAIKADGTVNTAFMNNFGCSKEGFNNKVLTLSMTLDQYSEYNYDWQQKNPDGIIVGGIFTSYNGIYAGRVARFNLDGTFDTVFSGKIGSGAGGPMGGQVEVVAVNPANGDLYVGGSFETFRSMPVRNIVRLATSGTFDLSFANSLERGGFANPNKDNPWVQAIVFDDEAATYRADDPSAEHMIVGGSFTSVNGTSFPYLARLFREIDTDGDGLMDRVEMYFLFCNPYKYDSDDDGLSDTQELVAGTDAMNPDTDGDGIIDSIDRQPRSDEPNSYIDGPIPVIVGSLSLGAKLTVQTGTWVPSGVTFLYRWYIDDLNQPIESHNSWLVIRPEHYGHTISVVVVGQKAGLPNFARKSAATDVIGAGRLTSSIPVIHGTLSLGQQLQCTDGTWGPAPVDLQHDWYRDDTHIDTDTDDVHVVVQEDYGHTLKCSTTGQKDGYKTTTEYSAPTGIVGQQTFKAGTISISGTLKVGKKLTVKTGTWKPVTPSNFHYQWYRGDQTIKGATKSTYTIKAADKGYELRVRVTGTRANYAQTSIFSKSTKTIAGGVMNAKAVSISGSVKVGNTVKVKTATWTPSPVKFSYQWHRDGKAIKGATKSTYTIKGADLGHKLSVTVTGKKSGVKSASKTSAAKKVAKGAFVSKPVVITGDPVVGSELHAQTADWSPKPKFKVQWYANGKAISGATKATYVVQAGDVGKAITVKVTATADGLKPVSKTSAPVTIS